MSNENNTTIDYHRHCKKNGQDASPEGLKEASKKFKEGSYDCGAHGPLARTKDTLEAALGGNTDNTGIPWYEIKIIGTDGMFDPIATEEVRAAVGNGETWVEAVYNYNALDIIEKFEELAAQGVKEMFDKMDNGQHGLMIGHDPIISMAARYFGLEAPSLKELQGIRFTQDENGNITAEMIND